MAFVKNLLGACLFYVDKCPFMCITFLSYRFFGRLLFPRAPKMHELSKRYPQQADELSPKRTSSRPLYFTISFSIKEIEKLQNLPGFGIKERPNNGRPLIRNP